jgi:hypothetical protein
MREFQEPNSGPKNGPKYMPHEGCGWYFCARFCKVKQKVTFMMNKAVRAEIYI